MTSIELNGLWLSLGPGIQGKLHVFETSSNPEQLAVPLEERFAVGQTLQVGVVYLRVCMCRGGGGYGAGVKQCVVGG